MNKIQAVDMPTEPCTIDIAGKEKNIEDVVSINTHMTHLSLLTLHGRQQASDQRVPQTLQQNTQCNFVGQTESAVAAAAVAATKQQQEEEEEDDDDSEAYNCYRNKAVLDDLNRFVNDENDASALLEIILLEEFYENEFWTKERLTESEQVLFARKLKSLLDDASKSAATAALVSSSVNPLRKVLELEYYSLAKLLEHIEGDIEQSVNIQIAETIMEEEEQEEQEEYEKQQRNNNNNGGAS